MRVGVYDSGIGGLTVLGELRRRFPEADYIYLGDTANVPYGSKSSLQIERLSRECARQLKAKRVDLLVVACNTASSFALEAIREEMGATPVLGVVNPGVEAILSALPGDEADIDALTAPILILATSATVRSGAYGSILRKMLSPDILGRLPLPIIEQACPLLVPMIEEGWIDHPILHQTIHEYVGPHLKGQEVGVVLLGCTHYPWIEGAFQKALPGWKVINSAKAIADVLEREYFLGSGTFPKSAQPSRVEWIFTDPLAVPAFARQWIQAFSEGG